ncbi:DUF4876 domain-containing protein [Sphingobacterium spiritivorum]|uniref:DUF4876 domain-containing protein n=1 Tax=Sphingobacterium spiritivorum TaxID=258 RepID=UPI00191A2C60|nr:DUF4876 domain-containing protein [Sphingobacterium spiritivorum]QQT28159.1 DUF4876 domain-containing protein [Sphingobacterium spiritivorum]
MKIVLCTTYLLIASMGLVSCRKDWIPENHPVDIGIDVKFYSTEYDEKLSPAGAEVKIMSIKGDLIFSGKTDQKGHLSIPQLAPDNYRVQATKLYNFAEFNTLLKRAEESDIAFSSLITDYTVNPNNPTSLNLSLQAGQYSPLVIKQLYYAGSSTTQGASFRDQFIEIYNNSAEVQYADSLYIGEAMGTLNASTTYAYQPVSKQYDWSKSYGMPANINANEDYVYARTVLMIPGTGKQYPINPGESIVIAATAINHKSPYSGTDGKEISVKDPSLTIDLSNADFEAHYAPYLGTVRPLASDVDNPNVPNLTVFKFSGTDLIMSVAAQQSWFIFRNGNLGEFDKWPSYDYPFADGRVKTGVYLQIPVANILDAVDLQSAITNTNYPKKFNAEIDAGQKSVTGGQNSSNSIIRKTKEIINGRKVLSDTNNSTEDFITIKAEPRAFAN